MEKNKMKLYPIKTKIIKPGEDIIKIILNTLEETSLPLKNNDILVLAESAVATSQNRIVKLSSIKPSEKALKLSQKYKLDPRLAELILQEADVILGGVEHVLLTIKDKTFQANAGIDKSNVPEGCVTLLPLNPTETAEKIRRRIYKTLNVKIGVIIADSRTQPLRLGNVGMAVGVAGFKPVKDERGHRDLFNKPLRITRRAIADNLASAAEVLMGEADESIPAVLIRGAPVEFTDEKIPPDQTYIPPNECLYVSVFKENLRL